MRPNHIVILLHKHDTFDDPPYVLNEIAKIWRDNGLRVTVLHGPGLCPEADVAILHVDSTRVSEDYLAFIRRYPIVLNGSVSDISKRMISANLVCYGDDYDGEVVVKSNLNCGGYSEGRRSSLLRRCARRIYNKMPWSFRLQMPVSEYRVFKSAGHVPWAAWHNPYFVVERFLPEMHEGYYCLRSWIFLGDREINVAGYSHHPIVKSGNMVRVEKVKEAPDELRQIRKKLGFDFGKFDYAIVDGRPVLYDVNSTPTLGSRSKEEYQTRIRLLAEGIQTYF